MNLHLGMLQNISVSWLPLLNHLKVYTVQYNSNSPYTCLHQTQKNFTTKSIYEFAKFYLAWENSQHFATGGEGGGGCSPLVSLGSDIWEMIAEIPFWWCITTQIWVVLLIGCAVWEFCFSQSEVLLRSVQWHVFSMEFLPSSFRHPLNCPLSFCF